MTPQEAIKHGKEQLDIFGGEHQEFIEMAIKALEQQPCEDCISRAEALKHSHIEYDDDGEGHRVVYVEDIEQMPSVTPQPKIGKWIGGSICNRCNYKKMPLWQYKYCPNCGSKMEAENEKETC